VAAPKVYTVDGAANQNSKLHGKSGAIWLFAAKGQPNAVKAASKVEWTLSLNRDYVDATVFGDTNKTYLVGLKDISGTFGGLLDVSGDLMLALIEKDEIGLYLYADDGTNGGTEHLIGSGPSLFDASITGSNTDAIRMTGNFRAAGPWDLSGAEADLTVVP